jgi:hypothetical protein
MVTISDKVLREASKESCRELRSQPQYAKEDDMIG